MLNQDVMTISPIKVHMLWLFVPSETDNRIISTGLPLWQRARFVPVRVLSNAPHGCSSVYYGRQRL